MSSTLLNNSTDGWELQEHREKNWLGDVTELITDVINTIKRDKLSLGISLEKLNEALQWPKEKMVMTILNKR